MDKRFDWEPSRDDLMSVLSSSVLQPPAPEPWVQAVTNSLYGEHRKGFVAELNAIMEDALQIASELYRKSMNHKFLPVLLGIDELQDKEGRMYHEWMDLCLWASAVWRNCCTVKRNCDQFDIWLQANQSGNVHAPRFLHQYYKRLYYALQDTKTCLEKGPLPIRINGNMPDKQEQMLTCLSDYINWPLKQLNPDRVLTPIQELRAA